MEGSSKILTFSNVTVSQANRVVLRDVNFSIEKGEFTYLIGRTGSGKSSLMKCIYRDLLPDSGTIHVGNYEVVSTKPDKIPFLRRQLGIVFQDFQLFMDRSVQENLLFVLKATGWTDSSKMKKRISQVLMKVGMSGHTNKMPHQLSGGEQQRVVIARALLNDPLLIIADEPTGNLDPEVSKGIMAIFKNINMGGTSVFMATHNHHFIREFPARVLKCQDGSVLDSDKETFEYADTWN